MERLQLLGEFFLFFYRDYRDNGGYKVARYPLASQGYSVSSPPPYFPYHPYHPYHPYRPHTTKSPTTFVVGQTVLTIYIST